MIFKLVLFLVLTTPKVRAYETFELYQPQRDRQFLITILEEHSPWLLDVISLKSALVQLEDSSHLSILKKDNKPIGFVNYEILNRTFMGIPIGQYGYINGLAIATQYHNMGYGKKLLQHCINELKNDFYPVVRLQVRSDNDAAIALYKHAGFEKIEPSKYFNSIEYYQFELQLQ